jgi:hypothetical protein
VSKPRQVAYAIRQLIWGKGGESGVFGHWGHWGSMSEIAIYQQPRILRNRFERGPNARLALRNRSPTLSWALSKLTIDIGINAVPLVAAAVVEMGRVANASDSTPLAR